MVSVESTSRGMPFMVSRHCDKWRMSLKNRPCGWSGPASTSPLGLETIKVEPSRMLTLLLNMGNLLTGRRLAWRCEGAIADAALALAIWKRSGESEVADRSKFPLEFNAV